MATLNIRHGGTKSAAALAIRLLGYDADLLVITEFRLNDAGRQLVARLNAAGYAATHPDTEPKQNTVLIASRRGINERCPFPSGGLDTRHLWYAEVDEILVCGVYMPQSNAKLPYWETLIAHARRCKVDLLIGDFNTGNNDLDKDPKGAKFIGPEMPGRLADSGYTDVWRSLHPAMRNIRGSAAPAATASVSTTSSPCLNSRKRFPHANSTITRG